MTVTVEGPLIEGTVRNAQTDAPMAGVTVTPSSYVYTDPLLGEAVTTLTTTDTGEFAAFATPGVYTFTCSDPAAGPIESVVVLGTDPFLDGPQGVQGAQGVQGPAGEGSGPQGPQGVTGAGSQGVQGAAGVQGPAGTQGNQGFQGTGGGAQGNQGFQGVQGTQGFQGAVGSQGTQGTQGNQGNQGTQGHQGFQGTQGTQGNAGTQGNQGSQGTGAVSAVHSYIIFNGSNYEAHLASSGAIIGSASDAGTVINGASTAANSAGGGMIELRVYGSVPVTTGIVLQPYTGLIGRGYNYDRTNTRQRGTVLTGSGLTGPTQAVVTIGSAGVTTTGCGLWDIGIDGGGTTGAVCVHATNATDLTCMRVLFSNGYRGLWLDGTLTGASGGEGAELNGCFWRGFGQEAIRVEPGSGVTDGHVIGGSVNSAGPTSVVIGAGGWMWHSIHFTGNSTVSTLVSLQGAPALFTGCYFDTATAAGGYLLDTTGGNNPVVTGCYFVQPAGSSSGCIKFAQLKGTIVGNFFRTVAGSPFCVYAGTFSSGVIPATFEGFIANNHGTGEIPVSDTGLNAANDPQATAGSYIGPNRHY